MGQVTVVRQKQQALRLLVQPPHRRHAELPVALRDQLHHGPVARVVRGGHIARRLVQHEQHFSIFFDRRAVNGDGAGRFVKFSRLVADDLPVHRHAPRADEASEFLAGARPRLREDLIEPLHAAAPFCCHIFRHPE